MSRAVGMLLTLTSTTVPARHLGDLLRKHPDRLQTFAVFGVVALVSEPVDPRL